ncbi:MAG: hypothetical protein CML50_22170 [Rhodobacteraceae bacterium]|uniref:Uncharacterized protein n=1 Tax=Salipiger profundus TaxID=1229727 RepID=A0A1U7D5V6_9RHOB|nr:hypothetical protein Ga0080559_TMP2735 [Salipiger profundus]MAB08700.1 hypothetical protein [Paracoccaceae bacterium]
MLAALFAAYLLLPVVPLWIFGQDMLPGTVLMTRRGAIPFLGIAAMLMLSRNAPRSEARQAIVIGLIVVYLGLALVGAQAALRGIAGWLTWATVAVEILLAISLLPHLRSRETDAT